MRLAPGARLCLVLLLVLVVAGCAVSPPEGAYFDVDRHPVGAVPANAGFYAGAYVVAPAVLFLASMLAGLDGHGGNINLTWEGMRGLSMGIGTGTGAILGAPFHLVALPFRSREKDAEPAAVEGPVTGGNPGYDDTPPEVPRDYPWPPKPAR